MECYYESNARLFGEAVRYLRCAISNDITRPYINQLRIGRADNVVTMASTDGHRVHRMHQQSKGLDFQAAMPRGLVELLSKTTDMFSGLIRIVDDQILLESDNHNWTLKASHDNFPPTENAIPTVHTIEDTVNVKEFKKLLRDMMKLVHKDKECGYRLVKISRTLEDSSILKIVALGGGDAQELAVLASQADSDAEPVSMGINLNYLMDAIKPLRCEAVNLRWLGPLDPLVITTDKQDATKGLDWAFDCVIMPMRI